MKNKIKNKPNPGFSGAFIIKARACVCACACARVRACVPTPCHRPPSPEVPVALGVDVDTLVGEQQLDHLGMVIGRRLDQSRPPAAERRTASHAQEANAARHQTACWRARTPMRMRGPNMPPSNNPIQNKSKPF